MSSCITLDMELGTRVTREVPVKGPQMDREYSFIGNPEIIAHENRGFHPEKRDNHWVGFSTADTAWLDSLDIMSGGDGDGDEVEVDEAAFA